MSETIPLINEEECDTPREVTTIQFANYNCLVGAVYCCICVCSFPIVHFQIFLCFLCFLPIFILIFTCLPCLLPTINSQRPSNAPLIARVFSFIAKNFLTVFPQTLINGWEPLMEYVSCINHSDSRVKYRMKTIEYRSRKHHNRRFSVNLHIYEPKKVTRHHNHHHNNNNNSNTNNGHNGHTILLYFHGGGFIMGHPFAFNCFFKEMVRNSNQNYILIAPRYKLANQKYKVDSIVREAVSILKYIVSEYSIPQKLVKRYNNNNEKKMERILPRVILSGDSCGGKLAMLVANYLRDHQYEIIPKNNVHVMPLYPPVLKRNQQIYRNNDEKSDENNDDDEKSQKSEQQQKQQQQIHVMESRENYGVNGYLFTTRGYEDHVYPLAEEDDVHFDHSYINNHYHDINNKKKPKTKFRNRISSYNEFNFFDDQNLQNLPSHFFVTAEFCLFRSECELYYQFLNQSKRKNEEKEEDDDVGSQMCEYYDVKNEMHGFTAQKCVTLRGKSSLQEVVKIMNDNIYRRFFSKCGDGGDNNNYRRIREEEEDLGEIHVESVHGEKKE